MGLLRICEVRPSPRELEEFCDQAIPLKKICFNRLDQKQGRRLLFKIRGSSTLAHCHQKVVILIQNSRTLWNCRSSAASGNRPVQSAAVRRHPGAQRLFPWDPRLTPGPRAAAGRAGAPAPRPVPPARVRGLSRWPQSPWPTVRVAPGDTRFPPAPSSELTSCPAESQCNEAGFHRSLLRARYGSTNLLHKNSFNRDTRVP